MRHQTFTEHLLWTSTAMSAGDPAGNPTVFALTGWNIPEQLQIFLLA